MFPVKIKKSVIDCVFMYLFFEGRGEVKFQIETKVYIEDTLQASLLMFWYDIQYWGRPFSWEDTWRDRWEGPTGKWDTLLRLI